MLALTLLAAMSFFQVFMLGFQSRCVNAGNWVVAFFCSSAIGMSQVYVWKHVMETTGLIPAIVYSLSGGCAIVCAIFVHKKYLGTKRVSA